MANILDFGGVRALTSDAQPGAGYVAKFYEAGTTTPVTVYTDSTLNTAHGVSVAADAAGRFPAVWSSGGAIKAVIEDADGAVIDTIETVLSVAASSSAAEDITFTPTIDLPFTNVQDAVEGAVAVAASGYAAFGLGITGNADVLASLNATGTASGVYRFDGATTGTFPTGVVAATTGIVTIDRQTSAEAVMTLRPAGVNRLFVRFLAASSWQAWREVPTALASAAQGAIAVRGASGWDGLALGASGTALISNGTTLAYGTPDPWSRSAITNLTGANTDISTALPSDTRRINVYIRNASLDTGATLAGLQLGTGGSYVTSGYTASAGNRGGENTASNRFLDFGGSGAASSVYDVTFRLYRYTTSNNIWFCDHIGALQGGAPCSGFGQVTLTTAIDRIRYNAGGANFDGGTVIAEWSSV